MYRRFAHVECAGTSPTYERLSLAVAEDDEMIDLLMQLPRARRQPNLLLAANRYLGGPSETWDGFREHVMERRVEIIGVLTTRTTQTNEPARCAGLVAALADIPGPVALVEVGSSAGLCLLPDRYSYSFGGRILGPRSRVHIEVSTTGDPPVADALPEITWRHGVDLSPLDVTVDDDVSWLRACIWPEHAVRRLRLNAACDTARVDPPLIARGDLFDHVASLLHTASHHGTPVLWHSAVLAYVPGDRRGELASIAASSGAVWISAEAPGVVEGPPAPELDPPPGTPTRAVFELRRDRIPIGLMDPHGSWIRWFGT